MTAAGVDIPTDGAKAGSLATRAGLALQQPLQDDSRQHSWTAGRPAPKYRPATNLTHVATRLQTHMPRTSSGLQTLEEEDHTQIQSPSILP